MRLALVTGEYPPLPGGVGDYTRELARALQARGHVVAVWTDRRGGEDAPSSVPVFRVVPRWDARAWFALGRSLRAWGPDGVLLQYQAAAYGLGGAMNLWPAIARLWLGEIPIVVVFHDLRVPYLFPKAGPLRAWSVRFLARRAKGVIVTNHEDEAVLRAAGIRFLRRIPIGSNIMPPSDLPPPSTARARLGFPGDLPLVGFFGFLHPSKGFDLLLEAVAMLTREGAAVGLVHIGATAAPSDPSQRDYAAWCRRRIIELGLQGRVWETGYRPPEEISLAFAAVDLCALPYRDGVSFRRGTLMAALAHGRAVISTFPRVSIPELQDGDNIFLVPPDDVKALALAIRRVLGDPDLRLRLERGARMLAKRFAWERIAAQVEEVFQSLSQRLQK
ncbi:glycosyltransferase [Thermoflexus sp.]|uniref:glycosyltransferase n=1 Tax=Thermoflexus sp. TaxID=1969742 RepID=UPI0025F2CB9A|nr:glycosyltransferase [Thermoflexus sp.]MCS7349989.1 glycosyltransferase [Thermoflexus sp.]MCX7690161.1 glycosyltransferase [Thermoflexus sp.]MDW8179437.1 glycosyltransferase [Anaerolineae bacterium]